MQILLLVMTFLYSFSSFSSETTKKRELVKIAYSDVVVRHAPDYIQMVSKIYEEAGIDVENHVLPSIRALNNFEKGMVDALGVRIDGYELLNKDAVKIPTPILSNTVTRAWVLKERKEEILKSKSISYSAVRGDISSLVYQIETGVKINEFVSTYRNVLKMVKKSRTDAIICTEQLINLTGNSEAYVPLNNKKVVHTLHHFIHKSKAHLLPKLQAGFEKMKGQGKFLEVKTLKSKK